MASELHLGDLNWKFFQVGYPVHPSRHPLPESSRVEWARFWRVCSGCYRHARTAPTPPMTPRWNTGGHPQATVHPWRLAETPVVTHRQQSTRDDSLKHRWSPTGNSPPVTTRWNTGGHPQATVHPWRLAETPVVTHRQQSTRDDSLKHRW